MMDSEFFKKAYSEHWELCESRTLSCLEEHLDYDKYLESVKLDHSIIFDSGKNKISSNDNDNNDLIYPHQMVSYTRELLNIYNQFLSHLNNLIIWDGVISKYSDKQEQFYLRQEFFTNNFNFCLHQPHEFKERIIFSAIKLCYTNGLKMGKLNSNDIKKNENNDEQDVLSLAILKKLEPHWLSIKTLVKSIEKIGDQSLANNYRNRRQHRQPPLLNLGIITKIKRTFHEDGFTTKLMIEEALVFSDLLPEFKAQAKLMLQAFRDYWHLVESHKDIN